MDQLTLLFIFKRDEGNRERIYVGNVCVAAMNPLTRQMIPLITVHAINSTHIFDAIERADEAGFWDWDHLRDHRPYVRSEVTVDVPVTDNATLSVTVGGDES